MMRMGIVILILLMVFAGGALGERIDSDTAEAVAAGFLSTDAQHGARPQSQPPSIAAMEPIVNPGSDQVLGYLVRLRPRGYIVVAPDTLLPPIIAFSMESVMPSDTETANPLLDLVRMDLSLRLEAVDRGMIAPDAARTSHWSAMSSTAESADMATGPLIGPLIESTTWGQSAPWNSEVPVDPTTGTRAAVGCVATALAQILNYWQYPRSILFDASDDYTSATRRIPIDASDASITRIEYGEGGFRNPDDEVMARLSYAAGVAVRMDYASAGSGAIPTDAAVVLAGGWNPYPKPLHVGLLGYASAELHTCVNAHWGAPYYETASQFYNALREDLAEGRPAMLTVKTGNSRVGHTLICDGYDGATQRFHLNLGWGGYTDGWYALPQDMPAGYNVVEYGILNIQPPDDRRTRSDESDRAGVPSSSGKIGSRVKASPIPSRGDVVFSFTGSGTADLLQVLVYDLSGTLVWSARAEDTTEVRWSGSDQDGAPVPHGPYIYVVTAVEEAAHTIDKGTLFIQP